MNLISILKLSYDFLFLFLQNIWLIQIQPDKYSYLQKENQLIIFQQKANRLDFNLILQDNIKMNQNKRLKINKRDKQSYGQMNFQKQMTIEQAYELQKSKNLSLKQRNQKLQVKCRFLYQKLFDNHQGAQQVFNNLNEQIWQNDKKIIQLQEQLYFRHSKQMNKLKKRIKNFFQAINFQIDVEDLNKINDQIDMILLLLDVFQIKYDEVMGSNSQTQQLIRKLQQPQKISGTAQKLKQYQQQISFYIQQNEHLKQITNDLQRQIKYLKNTLQDKKNIQNLKDNGQNTQINKAIQKLKARINELQSQKSIKQLQIQRKTKKISQLEYQQDNLYKRLKSTNDEIQKFKKDQIRWKQRFSLMQQQKNQRIRLLQIEINKKIAIQSSQDSVIGFFKQ